MARFGERLDEILTERNQTPIDLGTDLNIEPSLIYKWIANNSGVNLDRLLVLNSYFQCSLDFLAGRIDIDVVYSNFKTPDFFLSLRKVMDEKGITEYRMTKDLKVSRNSYFNWSKGSNPRLSTLIVLADYFDCSLDYLVGRE